MALAGWAGLCGGASAAIVKGIGADGRVTYSELPPDDDTFRWTAASPRALELAATGGGEPAPLPLPPPLREAATRYPVVLYASAECAPCDTARQWLQRRGVPFAERRVVTAEEVDLLAQRTGAKTLPAATIGRQALVGFSETEWQGYLEAAGYPPQPALPAGYRAPAAERLIPPRLDANADVSRPLPPPGPPGSSPDPVAPPPAPGGIRF